MISTIFLVPNIFFWQTGSYFGSSDEMKPLLHMWSLGVEEQFYLLFPLFFIGLRKFIKKQVIIIILLFLAFMASLFLLIFMRQIGGQNPAFFLLPTRVWEFLFESSQHTYFLQRKLRFILILYF